jgi:hypothetical protein
VSYSFPSAFTSFDPTKAFGGGYGDFSSVGKLNSGGSSSMLGPALGFAGSIGSSLIGGAFGNAQAAAQMRLQNQLANEQIIAGRNLAYGQLGESIGNRVFGATTAPDLDITRQAFAKRLEQGPIAERQFGIESEASRRELNRMNSPAYREALQFQNRLAMDRKQRELTDLTTAMFGPIA